jgi:hypothetical protein
MIEHHGQFGVGSVRRSSDAIENELAHRSIEFDPAAEYPVFRRRQLASRAGIRERRLLLLAQRTSGDSATSSLNASVWYRLASYRGGDTVGETRRGPSDDAVLRP